MTEAALSVLCLHPLAAVGMIGLVLTLHEQTVNTMSKWQEKAVFKSSSTPLFTSHFLEAPEQV